MDSNTDTFVADDVSEAPRQMATNGAMMTITPSQFAKSDMQSRTLPLEKAHKIVQFYTDNPSWLADPRTSHAAEAVLGSATKVISLNMQLERANNLGEAARTRTAFTSQKIKDLSAVGPRVPQDDVEGQAELGRLNGMIGANDFNLQDFATGVSRLQSRYKTVPGKEPTFKTLVDPVSGEEVKVVYGPSGAPTVVHTLTEADTKAENAIKNRESTWVVGEEALGKLQTVKMTPKAFADALPGLPEAARTNAVNIAKLKAAGFDVPSAAAPAAAPTTGGPSQADIDYLKKNPRVRDLFEKRFGKGSAASYLK